MLNLLKKDLRACFQMDIKFLLKLFIGITIFSIILSPLAVITVPLFISYIFIFRIFYLDELNKCDYFFNSMPIDKEDIVYSRYIFSTFIILASLIFTYVYSKVLGNIFETEMIILEVMLTILSLLIILVAIAMPIIFKYGYSKSYVALNLILGIIVVLSTYVSMVPKATGVILSDNGEVLLYNNTKFFIILGIAIVIYLISMFISTKLYTKREIAN